MKKFLLFMVLLGVFNLPVFAADKYPRKIVMEEATGTWCGWCVRGIETLKRVSEDYPNNFIGIAIHSSDEMRNAENYVLSNIGTVDGYPGCFINRRTQETETVDYYYAKNAVERLKDAADAKIEASAYFADAAKTSVLVKTKTTFGFDNNAANYKIAYVVLEDNVGPYNQRNFYSGLSYDKSHYMYDWTLKEAVVSIKFDDVARGIYPSVYGQNGSVPSTVKAGKANEYEFTITLPTTISDKKNISIVTLLINSDSGEIMNADKVSVSTVSVKLNNSKVTIQKGKTVTLKATVSPSSFPDKSVTWKSSNTKVATVTADGKVKGVAAGTATITCTSAVTGAKATCKVTVGSVTLDKSKAVIKKGKTLTLKATVLPTTDTSVTWESSDEKVATVTSTGKVKGVKTGTATITCTSVATGLKATCQVTIGLVNLNKYELTLKKGKTETLTATVYPSSLTDKSVTWTSSNEKVATVTADGKVKGVKTGTATITCTSNATGLTRTCEVTVANLTLDQYEAVVKKGKTVTLTATVYPSTLEDKSVRWESSDEKIATVTSGGKVKGVKTGTVTITCTSVATGLSRTCQVTVGLVSLNKYEMTLVKGKTETLTATVYPSSLTDKSVTWESSNTKIATVTSEGKVKGIKAGTATITCTSVATGLSRTCEVTVTASSGTRTLEGDDDETTGIKQLNENTVEPYDVYDLSGRKVLQKVTSLDGLPEGVYIVNGRKILKK